MAYNTKELLALPDKEKRVLAKKLWKSLAENHSVVKEDPAIIRMVNKRKEEIETGKAALVTPEQLRKEINEHRKKSR